MYRYCKHTCVCVMCVQAYACVGVCVCVRVCVCSDIMDDRVY